MITKIAAMIGISLLTVALTGCGTTRASRATEQLLMSDAVDRSVASIDFRPLTGRRVFLDTTYAKNIKNDMLVTPDYIISSVRQQMIGSGCLLAETREAAEIIAELRIGTLGNDSRDVVYGIPASSSLSSAASLVGGVPAIPIIPEIAVARKNDEEGAAKIAIFAYDRQSLHPVWQSGLAQARSRSKDTWILGAGPFRSGTIHNHTEFAASDLPIPLLTTDRDDVTSRVDPLANYSREATYLPTQREADGKKQEVQTASFESPATPAPAPPAPAAPQGSPSAPADAAPTPAQTVPPPPESAPPPPPQEQK
jgi:hypothetical protein